MKIENPMSQLHSTAERAGLIALFGELTFDPEDVEDLEASEEGDHLDLLFGNEDGPIGILYVDLYDSGNPDENGPSIGLRGWQLDDEVSSV
jgi:hypothetical protein